MRNILKKQGKICFKVLILLTLFTFQSPSRGLAQDVWFDENISNEGLVDLLRYGILEDRVEAARCLGQRRVEAAIPSLVVTLREDRELSVKEAAAEALSLIGEPALNSLIELFKDQNSHVRQLAVQAVGIIGNPRGVDPLMMVLREDGRSSVSGFTALALAKIGEPSLNPLLSALVDTQPRVRRWAAFALGKMKCQRAIEPLVMALHDETDFVRGEAVQALIESGGLSVQALIPLLQNEDYQMREYAIEILGKILDPRAVDPLILCLQDEELRENAAQALQSIGCLAVESLIRALQHENLHIRRYAAKILGEISDPKAFEPLLSLVMSSAEEDEGVRHHAKEALKKIRDYMSRCIDELGIR